MKKTASRIIAWRLATAVSVAVLLATSSVRADPLPTDPWGTSQQSGVAPNAGVVQNAPSASQQVQLVGPVIYGSQPYQPTYAGGANNIWNTKMPEFTGEMTTWGDSPNAKYNAPEVNMHNILSITQHLRNMGYKIPTSFEEKVKKAPNAARTRIFNAMNEMARNDDPFSKGARMALQAFEHETGLSYENLVGNSLNLMSSK
ncbi:MAG: hypothetical protein J5787_00875 [Alphaproteobacteria bacterium]|nr:hypothetical protein [Alphaproteobacteria bacterium]